MSNEASNSELGKVTAYDQQYNPSRLFAIPRAGKREEIGIDPSNIPFKGVDIWNHYEVSWLNAKGKPQVAIAVIVLPCETPSLVESKSMKLYFNSLNNTVFESWAAVENTIQTDLSKEAGAQVSVTLKGLFEETAFKGFEGENIDGLDVECADYLVKPGYLKANGDFVEETLCSDLLKSNCLITNQPDWASLQIQYKGLKIDREGLLQYIVSFRNHNEFHEQCIERIFVDIMRYCKPEKLTIYGRYTRRGGLDINPFRTTESFDFEDLNKRLVRQ